MNAQFIDINADLGESPEAIANGNDRELMQYVTSANVACGGHAGDAWTMEQTLLAAKALNVGIGAHPSFPDREHFGRVAIAIPPTEIEAAVSRQLDALVQVADEVGVRVTHVKPHGALYHATRNRDVALAVGKAVLRLDAGIIMLGQAGSHSLDFWRELGLTCAAEAFADRAYEDDGTLRSRDLPGAVLTPEQAAEQALNIVLRQQVITTGNRVLPVVANSICIHSDTAGAIEIARHIRERLSSAGIQIRTLSSAFLRPQP